MNDRFDGCRLVDGWVENEVIKELSGCMGILLRYLESEKFTLTKLWESITNLDVSLDVADRILHQLPTQEEARMYLNYEFTEGQPVDLLTDEDRLLLNLCKVNRLGAKLEVIVLMNTFDSTLASLLPKISAVYMASLNLKKSEKFKRLLELVLAFGNYMNSCRRGVAYGFRLQSLEILLDTKTPDKQTTLLHFLVETVEEKFPDLVNFYDDLDGITAASRVPMEALTSDVQAVVSGMTEADKELIATGPGAPQRLVNFIRDQSPRVSELQTKAETARNIFAQTTEWFGEALNKPSPETFFTCVVKFIQQFKKVQTELEKRRLAEQAMAMRKQSEGSLYNGKTSSYVPGTNVNATPSRQRKSKDRALAQEARLAKRRIQNRTRQINGDGMMDEILAALGSKPLQAEVHPRRSHFNNTNSSNNSSTDYLP
ncbi:unnamed protein product [Hymenolepis diminuta]|uniref:FH2 domain-containing protein n=1 Tax=Hymenolepis diminuta TaxID=6216 RepID=A0A158QDN8_HYMDI|nr:unnamed protein product [Hymenolepis diminuta]